MKFIMKGGVATLKVPKDTGKYKELSLNSSLLALDDHIVFVELLITYLQGKEVRTIESIIGRLNWSLIPSFAFLCINEFPTKTDQWRKAIKHAYSQTLSTELTTSRLQTRVKTWNSITAPFLEFLQSRDSIPLNVRIPRMKKVGELKQSSSFDVKLIGSVAPQKDDVSNEPQEYNNLLTPVSLSRTDPEYLEQIKFDLERKRLALMDALLIYWRAIKSHYEFGQEIISSFPTDHEELYQQYISEGTKTMKDRGTGPRRYNLASTDTLEGQKLFLYIVSTKMDGIFRRTLKSKCQLPKEPIINPSFFPSLGFESENFRQARRYDWCCGFLCNADISMIIALLMMLNPKFNFEPLLYCKVNDEFGRPYLQLDDLGMSFILKKKRAVSTKKETLDDTSIEIFSFLMEIHSKNKLLVEKEEQSNFLFTGLVPGKGYVSVSKSSSVSSFITGYGKLNKSKSNRFTYLDFFPSLLDVGLDLGTISHSKIRATEGVLEWFRTGSNKAAARKLGNKKKTFIEHYLPEALRTSYNTRIVRRFQNLLILSATYNEDYCLEAVDFNSLSEVQNFIKSLLVDKKNKSPLINYLREITSGEFQPPRDGDLHFPISQQALTALYLYRLAALASTVEPKHLSITNEEINISPMAFIEMANYLMNFLPNQKESRFIHVHENAMKQSKELLAKTSWSKLFVAKGNVS